MKKFLVLYRSTMSAREQMENMTPDMGDAAMEAWGKWFENHGSAVVEMGSPLGDSMLIKGAAGQDHIAGYSIVEAESAEAARKILEEHPHFEAPGPSIEFLEILPQPGM